MSSPRILILDNDPEFRASLCALLSKAGYETITTSDVRSAGPILWPDPAIDLLIVELARRGLSDGLDLISAVTRRRPPFKIIISSAGIRGAVLQFVSEQIGADAFLEKPKPGEPLNGAEWIRTVRGLVSDGLGQPEHSHAKSDLEARLVSAKESLKSAKEEYNRLTAIHADVDVSSDGQLALRHAMAAKQSAVSEYSKVLLEWIRFVEEKSKLRQGGG